MYLKRFILLFAPVVLLSGCATALSNGSQEIMVVTPGARESLCYLENGSAIYKVSPPQKFLLKSSQKDLTVRCKADGNREKIEVFEAEWNPDIQKNIVNGLLPGLIADLETGASHQYPDTIIIDFTGMQATAMPMPDYHIFAEENPELVGYEEFRPGLPALQKDLYEEPARMEKKDFDGETEFKDNFVIIDSDGNQVNSQGEATSNSSSSEIK